MYGCTDQSTAITVLTSETDKKAQNNDVRQIIANIKNLCIKLPTYDCMPCYNNTKTYIVLDQSNSLAITSYNNAPSTILVWNLSHTAVGNQLPTLYQPITTVNGFKLFPFTVPRAMINAGRIYRNLFVEFLEFNTVGYKLGTFKYNIVCRVETYSTYYKFVPLSDFVYFNFPIYQLDTLSLRINNGFEYITFNNYPPVYTAVIYENLDTSGNQLVLTSFPGNIKIQTLSVDTMQPINHGLANNSTVVMYSKPNDQYGYTTLLQSLITDGTDITTVVFAPDTLQISNITNSTTSYQAEYSQQGPFTLFVPARSLFINILVYSTV